MSRLISLLFLLCLLQGCATFSVVDEQGYSEASKLMAAEFERHGLPLTPETKFFSSGESYGHILLTRLSPRFMQGQVKNYYIGDTFKETLQPRRSILSLGKNAFHIEHMTQHVRIVMLAVCDWNGDGEEEWLVRARVTPKHGGKDKTWFLLVPAPRKAEEILNGTPIALRECVGQSCQTTVYKNAIPTRTEENTMPLTNVTEVKPGEQRVTTPDAPKEQKEDFSERSI
ncbi:MAG: hypothetical protein K5657_06170 [Desulfovibrio sp.]|nr:hypothetical protein [Desulfovibrio sp.]